MRFKTTGMLFPKQLMLLPIFAKLGLQIQWNTNNATLIPGQTCEFPFNYWYLNSSYAKIMMTSWHAALSEFLALCDTTPPPLHTHTYTRPVNMEPLWFRCQSEQFIEQTVEFLITRGAMMLMWHNCNMYTLHIIWVLWISNPFFFYLICYSQ